MDFSKALEAMKEGNKISRKGLYGLDISFEDYPGWKNKALVLTKNDGTKQINYEVDSSDLLATDWEIVKDIQEVKLHIKEYFTCPKCGHENIGFHLDNGVSTCTKCGTRVKTLPKCGRSNKKYGEIVSTYKEYLEKMISGFEDDTKECIASEQYQSAGISTWYKEAYEMCLQALNKIESKTSE